MQLRRQSREELPVNLTPLIDVVFLLLIFFMVSTTFTKENRLTIELPEAVGEAKEQTAKAIEVNISADGAIAINGKSLIDNERSTVSKALTEVSNGDTSMSLIIIADAKAPHQSVVTSMDAAGQLGFNHLSIATKPPSAEN